MTTRYYLRNRPPGYAQMPDGHTAFEGGLPSRSYPFPPYAFTTLPGTEFLHCFGWVEYPEPLTFHTLWRWDLLPADPVEYARYAFFLYADRDPDRAAFYQKEYVQTAEELPDLKSWFCPHELTLAVEILLKEKQSHDPNP